MSQPDPRQALIRLLATQGHSLPVYIVDARRPGAAGRKGSARRQLHQIATDRNANGEPNRRAHVAAIWPNRRRRISDAVPASTLSGQFSEFSGDHRPKRDIGVIERCVTDLESDPPGRALAEEALGAARGYLETLEELVAQHR